MQISKIFSRRAIQSMLRGFLRYVFGKRGQRRLMGWRMFYRLRTEVLLRTRSPITGISHFPRTRLWVDREMFPRIEKLLLRAQHTIVIQMFIWMDDVLGRRIASTLLQIADRGVKVYIFKEAVGDMFEFRQDFLTTSDAPDGLWHRFWHHPNIRITHENRKDHAKVYIIDDKILLLAGANIADEYHHRLHDYLVELNGGGFVEEYLTHGEVRDTHHNGVRLCMNSEFRKDIRSVVTGLIREARHSIVLEQCYFADVKVTDELIRKSHEGVRVTVVIPEHAELHHHANMYTVSRLITEGARDKVEVFLYPRMFHGKSMLIDRTKAFIGSVNLMTSSLDEMGEVNVLVEGRSEESVEKLRDVLRREILESRPLTSPPRFHWIGRLLGWLKL